MTATPRSPRFWRGLALTLAVALPLSAAGFVIGSLSSAPEQVDAIPAAVVNNDEMIEQTNDDGTTSIMFAGRQLVTDLTGPDREGFDWTITNASDAQALLDSGQVAAVLTIPDDFSERVMSLQGDDPQQAGITIVTNDAHDYVSGALADQVAESLTSSFGSLITQQFVAGVYGGMSTLASQLGEAADGASALADGGSQLVTGLGQLESGAGQLATGAGQAQSGASTLASGIGQLESGLVTAQSGAESLAGGASQFQTGLGQYTGGVDQLAAGLSQLNGELAPLDELGNALVANSGGAQEAATQAAAFAEQLAQDPNASPDLVAAAQQLAGALQSAADANLVGQAGGAILGLTGGVADLTSGAAQLSAQSANLNAGAGQLTSGAQQLAGGLAQSVTGAGQLSSGATEMANGVGQLSTGATQLQSGIGQSGDGATQLSTGADELANGLYEGADALPNLDDDAVTTLADVVGTPVGYDAETVNGVSAAGRVATLAVPIALWLGAIVLLLLIAPRFVRAVQTTASLPSVLARVSWRPLAAVAVSAALAALALPFAGIPWSAVPVSVLTLVLLGVIATLLTSAFVTLWGRAGYLAAAGLLLVQVVAAGGVLPSQLLAAPVQAVQPLLPLTYGVGALHQTFAGASAAANLWALVVFAVLAALIALGALGFARGRATKAFVNRPVIPGLRAKVSAAT